MLKWSIIIVVIVVILAGVAYAGIKFAGPKFSLRPAPAGFKTGTITRGDVLIVVTATGTVNPIRTVMVGSQVSGKVKEVRKINNDTVKQGEVLAILDTELLEQDKHTAEVHLAQTKAALALLLVERINLKLQEARLTQSIDRKKISVARSKGTLELASKNRQRSQDLLAVDATSQTDLDVKVLEETNSRHDLSLMGIDLDQTELDRQQIVNDGKQLDAKEEQTRADIQQADAALARTITNLGYSTILSPIDGVVLQHLVEPGQTVAASFQTPNMFKVASDLNTMRIDAALDEADIGKIKVGQEVTFDVDAYRGETFNGKVTMVKIQSEAKGNLVTYPVIVEAANPADKERPFGKLLPGMTAGLKFVADKRKDVVRLPAAALRFIPPQGMAPANLSAAKETKDSKKLGTRGTIFVADDKNMLTAKAVVVGDTDGDFFELIEGDVKEGDEVVVGTK